MGTTISDYLTEVRMKEAGRLIKEESQSVGEVAQKVGYIDVWNKGKEYTHIAVKIYLL